MSCAECVLGSECASMHGVTTVHARYDSRSGWEQAAAAASAPSPQSFFIPANYLLFVVRIMLMELMEEVEPTLTCSAPSGSSPGPGSGSRQSWARETLARFGKLKLTRSAAMMEPFWWQLKQSRWESTATHIKRIYLWCHHTLNARLIYIKIELMAASMKIKIINLHYQLQYITKLLMQGSTKEMKHKTSTIIKQFKSHKTLRFWINSRTHRSLNPLWCPDAYCQ